MFNNDRIEGRERGQTLVEYALIVGLVSVAAIVAVTALGTVVNMRLFDGVVTTLAGLVS